MSAITGFLILRPGALGDVLATRAALGLVRAHRPGARLVFAGPGERGRLLRDLADAVLDLSTREALFLFAEEETEAPVAWTEVLAGCSCAVAYMNDPSGQVRRNLERLGLAVAIYPPRPDERGDRHVYAHLAAPLSELLGIAIDEATPPPLSISSGEIRSRVAQYRVDAPYAVLHPGSGSPRKNWPAERFVSLGRRLDIPVVVTSGEADGELGARVAASISGSVHVQTAPLPELAAVLAGAALYVGNDSGVGHLAASVAGTDRRQRCLLLFGPTRPEVWAPAGARVLAAPAGRLQNLSVDAVYAVASKLIRG